MSAKLILINILFWSSRRSKTLVALETTMSGLFCYWNIQTKGTRATALKRKLVKSWYQMIMAFTPACLFNGDW